MGVTTMVTLTLRERALAALVAEEDRLERARSEREAREHREWVARQRAVTERAIGALDWFPSYAYDADRGLVHVDELTFRGVHTQRNHDLLVLVPRCSRCDLPDTGGVSEPLDHWLVQSLAGLGALLSEIEDKPHICTSCWNRAVAS